MEIFTIDLALNLLLSLVVLTHTITCSFESTNSSILNLLHTNTHTYNFKIPLKGFKSPAVVDLVCNNFKSIGSNDMRMIFGSDFEKKKAQHLLDLTRAPPKSS